MPRILCGCMKNDKSLWRRGPFKCQYCNRRGGGGGENVNRDVKIAGRTHPLKRLTCQTRQRNANHHLILKTLLCKRWSTKQVNQSTLLISDISVIKRFSSPTILIIDNKCDTPHTAGKCELRNYTFSIVCHSTLLLPKLRDRIVL